MGIERARISGESKKSMVRGEAGNTKISSRVSRETCEGRVYGLIPSIAAQFGHLHIRTRVFQRRILYIHVNLCYARAEPRVQGALETIFRVR